MIPTSEESSTNSGAAASFAAACRIFGHLPSLHPALAQLVALDRACEATKRWASSASDISRLNSATGRPWSIAAFSAMLVTRR